jgi:carboxymethylenebutenolidase
MTGSRPLRDRPVAARQRKHQRIFRPARQRRHASPRRPSKLPGIIVVHENRGLNPHIEDIARRLALANFMAFAPDGLTSLGGFPGDDYKGGQMFAKVDGKKMAEDFVAAAMWLKSRPDCTGKIGATGFCYGAASPIRWRCGWEPIYAAAVPFYGAFPRGRHSEDQGGDSGPSRGTRHAAGSDVAGVRHGLDGGQRSARRLYLPGAVHGFNCDATPERYNKAAADLAWQRTIDWFNKYVRG